MAIQKAMVSTGNGLWRTPKKLFKRLDSIFKFTIDLAADDSNHLVDRYFTEEQDCLKQSWEGEIGFMNPDFGKLAKEPWIEKAVEELENHNATSVWLHPARVETGWHGLIWEYARYYLVLKSRVHYEGFTGTSAPFASVVSVFTNNFYDLDKLSDLCYPFRLDGARLWQ